MRPLGVAMTLIALDANTDPSSTSAIPLAISSATKATASGPKQQEALNFLERS